MPQGTFQNNAHSFQLSEELHLWDLELQSLSKKYAGQKQDSYVIRSTFGGDEESFIISGSEGRGKDRVDPESWFKVFL